MTVNTRTGALILGISIVLGLASLGYQLAQAAVRFKQFERSVTVKGLAERELPADIVIWPIQFIEAGNDLQDLYNAIEERTDSIREFLKDNGIEASAISASTPAITDKTAQSYGSANQVEFRYTATQTVTVYSTDIDTVRRAMNELAQLGKTGIAFTGGDYNAKTEYLFTRLNDVKPAMIEEATTQAREVAQKFAADSQSRLGKIKQASQGQFSIDDRDKNNPHIKRIRVVSTVEYYLSD